MRNVILIGIVALAANPAPAASAKFDLLERFQPILSVSTMFKGFDPPVVQANCPSYPCWARDPAGVPITRAIDASQVVTVPFDETSTLTLEHLDQASAHGSSGVKLARVALEQNPDDSAYILEYRNGATLNYPGVSTDPHPLAAGVYLHLSVRDTGDPGVDSARIEAERGVVCS